MEPHACTAEWADGRLTVWTGTQTPFNVRAELASVFGLDPLDVRVVVPPMGGSFGAKTFCRLEPVVAALARKAGRPVRAVLDRDEVFVTLNRHPARFRMRLGARRDGTFVGRRVWAWWDTGAYADTGPNVAAKGGWAAVGPYRFEHVEVDSLCVYTHRPPAGAYRGYAATQAVWAGEQCVDLLAERLGIDPLELRLRNVLRDGEAFCTGEVLHDFRVAECLEDVAERIGWREGRRGKGLCALMKGMQTPSRCEAAIELVDGAFVVRSATTEIGQGAVVALPALAAAALGVERDAVTMGPVDTDLVPFDTRTTSSRSTHMMAGALAGAAVELRARIAEELEAAPGDLVLADGHASVRGVPARRVPLADLGALRGEGAWRVDGGLDPDTGQGVASAHWHQGAGAAEVAVDEETGRVEVVRLAAVGLRRAGRRPRARRAAAGRLAGHGPRQRPLRVARLRGRPGRQRQPVRLRRPDLRRRAAPRLRAAGAGGRRGARARRDGPPAGARRRRQRPALARAAAGAHAGARRGRAALGGRARRGAGVRIDVELNGAAVELEADAEEPLLAVLRREGLASVRPTCGIGVCGACTVLVDDEPISSCLLLAPLAAGRRLTTLEGLGEDPVQAAFERLGAYQCGYCTPGMILTARALLAREPDPSPARIREALAGNLCRCGCYGRIVRAVRAAAGGGSAC